MKQCDSCGTENSDEAAFCPACGKPMAACRPEPVVFSANGASAREKASQKIETHLVKAIIATICCCVPFGVVSIIYAAQVGVKMSVNDMDGAVESGKKADLWGNLAIGMGVLLQILWWLIYGAAVASVVKDGDIINYINR